MHALGGPSGSGRVTLKYDAAGKVTGIVGGTVYWDDLFLPGCSQLIIDFEDNGGTNLETRKIKVCGTGGNANDLKNKILVEERFFSGSIFQIRLRIGTLHDNGSFTNVKTKVCNFKECKDS